MEIKTWVDIIIIFLLIVGIIYYITLTLVNKKLKAELRELSNDLLDFLIKEGKNKEEIIKYIEEPETVLHVYKPIFYRELNKRFK